MLKRLALPLLALALCSPFAACDDVGTIVFYRPKREAGKPSVFCDGVRLARVPSESVFKVQAASGRHVCTVETVGNTKEAVVVEVSAGSASYLLVSQGRAYHMRAAGAAEAADVAAMLKPVDSSLVFQTSLGANPYATGAPVAVPSAPVPTDNTPAAASAAAPGPNMKVVMDEPLATTYYYPAKTATVRDGLIFWRVYPYIERKGDGSAFFHLRMSLYPPMDDTWSMSDARFTANDRDELPVDVRYLKATSNWPLGSTSYDFDGPELEDLVRRLASAQEAWLVVFGKGDPVRTNLRLKPEHLAVFREIVAQYDSLQVAAEP